MDWVGVLAVSAAIIGIAASGFLVARSPSFWVGLGIELFKLGMPKVIEVVTKRMTPEEEKAWHDAELRGKGAEWQKERFLRKAREARAAKRKLEGK